MKKIFILLFLLTGFRYCSANDFANYPDSGKTNKIFIQGDYLFGSNAITNKFVSDYFLGKFLTTKTKDEVSSKLEAVNRMGAEYNFTIGLTQSCDSLFGLNHSFLTFSFSDHYHVDARFKKDVFELYFRGNKRYEDKTADLSNFNLNLLHYQQFAINIGHRFLINERGYGWSAGLRLSKGQTFLNLSSTDARLYTARYGDYLDLTAALTLRRSDSTKTKLEAWNGTGVSTDLSFFWTDENKNNWQFAIENLGFMSWNGRSSYVHADTSFRFTGVDVSSLFDFADSVHTKINLDSSLVELYLKDRIKKAYTVALPGKISIRFKGKITNNIDLTVAADQFLVSNYLPAVMISPGFKMQKHTLNLIAHYGGYSKLYAGIGYSFEIKGWFLNIQSPYLSGIFTPGKSCAQGTSLSLSKSF